MDKQSLSLKQIIGQTEGNIVSLMGDEKVIFSVKNGKYYNLGVIGGVIWELISTPIKVSELISNLIMQYDITQRECEQQVLTFLEHLFAEQLITVNEQKTIYS